MNACSSAGFRGVRCRLERLNFGPLPTVALPAALKPPSMKIRRTCREVTHLVLESQERPLGGLEQLSLRLHWLACGGCRRFRQQHQLMQKALDRWRSYRGDD